MPGNPLPESTINLESRNWPYDPDAASGSRFGTPNVTPAALAVFDASNATEKLDTRGPVSFINEQNRINTTAPDGKRGWEVKFADMLTLHDDNQFPELFIHTTKPVEHFFERIQVWQPANYVLKPHIKVKCDISTIPTWAVGDYVTTDNGGTGYIAEIGNDLDDPPNPCIVFTDYTGHHSIAWNTDKILTNTNRSNETVISTGALLLGSNNKNTIWWVDDDQINDKKSGYSHQMYDSEVIGAEDFSGSAMVDFKYTGKGSQTNDLVGGVAKPKIYDVVDNGSWVDFVHERKRASGVGTADGIYRIWKLTHRTGGEFPTWTLIYEVNDIDNYDPGFTKFERGYIFGWCNLGYQEETTFYLGRYEWWDQKPTYLP